MTCTSKGSKMNFVKQGTPGPGHYRLISEFGKYGPESTTPALLDTKSTTPVKRA